MEPKTQVKQAIQVTPREETFPLQEQELFPVGMEGDLSHPLRFRDASRPAAQILTEQIEAAGNGDSILAPVFVP